MGRVMKDSGIEWIGEMPYGWDIQPILGAFKERKCKNRGNKETNLLSLSYGNIVRKDVSNNMGLLPNSFDSYNIVEKDNIVFRLTDLQNDHVSLRSALVNERGIITSAYVTLESIISLCSRFFNYLFRSYDISKVFYNMGGGVRQGINFNELRKLPIVIPPFSEQQAIADYLDRKCNLIENTIEKQKFVIEKLKIYKQAIITEAVTKGRNLNAKMKPSGIEWIGDIPETWNKATLKALSISIGDGLHGTPKYSDNGSYLFINGNNLGNEYITDSSKTNRVDASEYEKYKILLDFNTILISLNGTIGNMSFYNNELIVLSKSAGYIRLISSVNKLFIYYFLKSSFVKRYFESSYAGTTINNLSLDTLRNTPILLPDIDEQQLIANYLNNKCSQIDKIIEGKEELIGKLTDYKKSLIYECVTGKREVI